MASRRIIDLSIEMQQIANKFMAQCKDEGLDIVIICTHRDDTEQNAAFACGASNCKAGQSAHNARNSMIKPAAEAFDVGVIRNGKYIGDGKDSDYLRAGKIGESLGLVWAGRWTGKIREVAHFQNANWRKPT